MIGNITFTATARDEVIKVTATCGYGSRTVSVTKEITDEKLTSKLDKIFTEAIESVKEELSKESYAAAAESLVAATRRGEQI